jgi:hypothetical protein
VSDILDRRLPGHPLRVRPVEGRQALANLESDARPSTLGDLATKGPSGSSSSDSPTRSCRGSRRSRTPSRTSAEPGSGRGSGRRDRLSRPPRPTRA